MGSTVEKQEFANLRKAWQEVSKQKTHSLKKRMAAESLINFVETMVEKPFCKSDMDCMNSAYNYLEAYI